MSTLASQRMETLAQNPGNMPGASRGTALCSIGCFEGFVLVETCDVPLLNGRCEPLSEQAALLPSFFLDHIVLQGSSLGSTIEGFQRLDLPQNGRSGIRDPNPFPLKITSFWGMPLET